MVAIRAFRGYRPPAALAAKVAAPPYDVINSDEARALAHGNAVSFLHVNKPEIDLPASTSLYAPEVYRAARTNLERFIAEGMLVQDARPCLYAYRQVMDGREQLGLVCACAVDDYDNNVIRKHEFTRKDKEDDRTRHVDVTSCNAGPVFLTYRPDDAINGLMAAAMDRPPAADFAGSDGIRHTLWVIENDKVIGALIAAFKENVPLSYIADGHHRAASASRVRALRAVRATQHDADAGYNYFMAVLFPSNQLRIMDYNRVAKDLNGLTPEKFLARVAQKFDVAPVSKGGEKPAAARTFGLYLGGLWYRLTAKSGTYNPADPVRGLDVSILQGNLLGPVLGIDDPRTSKRIDFVGGIRGLGELEKRVDGGDWACAFAMYPTSLDELMAIADAGEVMPPKSTWFEPKLKSGLVVNRLDGLPPTDI